ncbi:hypothetical protein [Seleniivibrio woodruffii]|uniref:RND transporter n=1 Tax=Seleniivibrio woodruffii TaxID=1078050 RepID=A0A4R1KEX8_9BACT|nr:hypothetical protein [Seleniivibrio woodruffii]TCK62670.1 hypothetical protein C8D98_1204 [Seleniivibrio woodruffii]TVZ36904.1 hypothetical protein OF66_2545 [Seleniivibrio woodruffii]
MLKKLDYTVLIVLALFLGLAPFTPEPHVAEKLRMLSEGTLKRPIDIFDLFFHLAPVLLIVLKFALGRRRVS